MGSQGENSTKSEMISEKVLLSMFVARVDNCKLIINRLFKNSHCTY